jgi:spermidine synthase
MVPNSNRNAILHAALILIGFTSVIAQIVFMRELIVVFHGNEISLGIILTCWLLWTSVGSGLLGRLFLRAAQSHRVVASLQLAVAIIFPLTIVAIRVVPLLFHATTGEVLGPGPMFLASFLVMSLFCVISGCLFAAGSRLYHQEKRTTNTKATGSVYLLEAIGSGIGGLVASLILIRNFSSCEIALFLAVLNITAAAALTLLHRIPHMKKIVILLGCAGMVVAFIGGQVLETHSLRYRWRDLDVTEIRDSIYGNLAVISTEETRSVYQNGKVLFTVPDPAAAEEAVHYALLQHSSPRSLLLIGGGMNGSLFEALKHPSLRHVDYVELDPAIVALYRDHFAKEWSSIQSEPRITIHHLDGRFFLQRTQKTYDAIIINLPNPQTAQINRFYTVEFFRSVARRLSKGGVFSFQVTGAENYISEELAAFLNCLNKTLSQIFPEVEHIPGESIHFFASLESGGITSRPDILIERLRSRDIVTQYVREYYIPFRMTPDRMQELQSATHATVDTPENRDFTPIAYYFNSVLWSTRFHDAYRQFFQAIAGFGFLRLLGATTLILFVIIGLTIRRRGLKRLKTTAGVCITCMGFTMIGVEVLLLLAFQAIYGYVYHQLAIIIAAFMSGMALGSRRALRQFTGADEDGANSHHVHHVRALLVVQWIAVFLPILLVAIFYALSGVSGHISLFVTSHILFPALALLAGSLGGYQFPLCSKIYFSGGPAIQRGLGSVYAFDLVGACAGAFIFSTYLIPVFGFLNAAFLIALINTAPVLLLSIYRPARSDSI